MHPEKMVLLWTVPGRDVVMLDTGGSSQEKDGVMLDTGWGRQEVTG